MGAGAGAGSGAGAGAGAGSGAGAGAGAGVFSLLGSIGLEENSVGRDRETSSGIASARISALFFGPLAQPTEGLCYIKKTSSQASWRVLALHSQGTWLKNGAFAVK